jgi:hypothetical protein
MFLPLKPSGISPQRGGFPISGLAASEPVVAYPDEPLRIVLNRMAATGLTRFPVVQRGEGCELTGIIGLQDLLKARELSLDEEHHRERVLRLRLPPSLRWRWPGRNQPSDGAGTNPDAN